MMIDNNNIYYNLNRSELYLFVYFKLKCKPFLIDRVALSHLVVLFESYPQL